jgi:26S proteasome regulatory subunit N2
METESDEKKATSTTITTTIDDDTKSKKDVDDKDKVATTEKKDDSVVVSNKKEKEPDSEILHNPTRVVKAQQRLISLPKGSRYQPIKDITHAGIILIKDTQSNEPETLVELAKAGGPTKEEDLPEPSPPEPFEYRDE